MDYKHNNRMDAKLLINAIVKQTTVLIASLSTASWIRAPLSHVADQVFLDLAKEIESQDVGRKVVADMFGLALRTYQRKVQRLSESISARNRSLWEATYQYISEQQEVSRKQIEHRFRQDLPEDVAAVINDLVTNGLVFTTGHGANAVYRFVSASDKRVKDDAVDTDAVANLVWAAVYRRQANTVKTLQKTLGIPLQDIERAIRTLIEDGRISRDSRVDAVRNKAEVGFCARSLLVPVNAKQGWEAAVFDHFSAVATAIAAKINRGPGSQSDDVVGGATLCFEVHPDHPLKEQVTGLLRQIRAQVNALWEEVESYNRANPAPEQALIRVHFYFGQNLESQDAPLSEQ